MKRQGDHLGVAPMMPDPPFMMLQLIASLARSGDQVWSIIAGRPWSPLSAATMAVALAVAGACQGRRRSRRPREKTEGEGRVRCREHVAENDVGGGAAEKALARTSWDPSHNMLMVDYQHGNIKSSTKKWKKENLSCTQLWKYSWW